MLQCDICLHHTLAMLTMLSVALLDQRPSWVIPQSMQKVDPRAVMGMGNVELYRCLKKFILQEGCAYHL